MNLVKIVPAKGEDGKPRITQGSKVFLSDGSQLEGVTRVEILGEVDSVWTARIDVVCSMAEMDSVLAQIALTAYDAPVPDPSVDGGARFGSIPSNRWFREGFEPCKVSDLPGDGDQVDYTASQGFQPVDVDQYFRGRVRDFQVGQVEMVPDNRPGFFRFFSTGFCQFWEWLRGPKEAK